MLTEQQTKELLENIAQLGGKSFKEEDIVFEGQKLILPESFKGDLTRAIKFIQLRQKEDEEEAVFSRTFNYRPWDGAICAYRALKKKFGMVHGKTMTSFFGSNPPAYIQVPISATEQEEAPWGNFQVPLLDNTLIEFAQGASPEYGPVFRIDVTAPRKHRFVIEGLFQLVAEELETGSIYRGKAIDGQQMPQFIDLHAVDPAKVVYSEQVLMDLQANIFAVMRYPEQHLELGLPRKRAILLLGTYGTGKSLAGFLTALEAEKNGWTFLMARPGRDNFLTVMQTARLYQPACVFFEDAELMAGAEAHDTISQILDVFDGIQAKGTNLMVVMTTNHPDKLHMGMHRPGRIDSQISIGELDAAGIEKLIRSAIPEGILEDIDFAAVVTACEGYVPAFVKEVADRAVRYALVRSDGHLDYKIGTQDLVHAAGGLRDQFNRMQGAPEVAVAEQSLTAVIEGSVKKGVAALATPAENPDVFGRVWNVEKLQEAQKNGTH